MEICEYEYDSDDEYPFEVRCSLDRGHEGNHHATLTVDWPTRDIDVCREQGHVWGSWQPMSGFDKVDISSVLLENLMGARVEVIKPAANQRFCGRCRSRETDGESRLAGGISLAIPRMRITAEGSQLVWIEDGLNGP